MESTSLPPNGALRFEPRLSLEAISPFFWRAADGFLLHPKLPSPHPDFVSHSELCLLPSAATATATACPTRSTSAQTSAEARPREQELAVRSLRRSRWKFWMP